MSGSFRQRFGIRDFPFDCQYLTIDIRLGCSHEQVRFVPELLREGIRMGRISRTHSQPERPSLDGRALVPNIMIRPNLSDPADSASGTRFPQLCIETMVTRNSGYYGIVSNALAIDFTMTLVAFSVYQIPHTEFSNRMSLSLALLLTTVAFKFVCADKLPTISYLTMIDKCVLSGFCVQVRIVAHNAMMVSFPEDAYVAAGVVFFAVAFVIYNVHFVHQVFVALRISALKISRYEQWCAAKHGTYTWGLETNTMAGNSTMAI